MLDPSLRRSAQKVGTQKVGTQKVQRDTKFIYFNPATPRTSNSMFSSKSQTATFTAYHHTALHFEAKKFAAMPTLVWVRRPESAPNAAAREGSATRREAAVPDPVVSAAAAAVPDGAATSVSTVHADPVYVAFPAVSTKRPADGVEKKKRKSAEAVTDANKKSKATSERDLPTGVRKLRSGKYESRITWGDKTHYIGVFDIPEQASAAHLSVMKDRDDVELSALGADEVDTLFDAAKQKAVKAEGGFVRRKKKLPRVGGFIPRKRAKTSERDLYQGFYKTSSGKFISVVRWGGKLRDIGTFDTPEQASAAFMSVKKYLEDAKLSAFGADEVEAAFDAAKTRALKTLT